MKLYPTSLLSRIQYQLIELESLVGKGFFVIRRPVPGEILLDPDTGKINVNAVCEFAKDKDGKLEIFGLSVNLYGIFKVNDLVFVLLNPSNKEYWEEGMPDTTVDTLKYDVVDCEEALMIYIDDLKKSNFTYKDPERGPRKNDPEWKEVRGNMAKADEYKARILVGWKELLHRPLIGNFWHFEWHYYEEDGTPIPSRYKKLSDLIALNEAETWLKEKAKVYNNDDYELNEEIYLKKT